VPPFLARNERSVVGEHLAPLFDQFATVIRSLHRIECVRQLALDCGEVEAVLAGPPGAGAAESVRL